MSAPLRSPVGMMKAITKVATRLTSAEMTPDLKAPRMFRPFLPP